LEPDFSEDDIILSKVEDRRLLAREVVRLDGIGEGADDGALEDKAGEALPPLGTANEGVGAPLAEFGVVT